MGGLVAVLGSAVEMLKWRRTKIVATLGPASCDPESIDRLIAAGVDVVRLNMSHGDHDTHAATYEAARAAARRAGKPLAILADLCGPKLRVGRFDGGSTMLPPGGRVTVTTRDVLGGPGVIPSRYAGLHEEITPGCRILIDDGQLELRVDDVTGREITCTVVRGGLVKDRKGMNLPDTDLSAPALTDQDRLDARFAVDLGVDHLALSFVRRASDVEDLRALLPADSPPRIIAKIERPEALQDIEAILEAADGIMVARGDLGVELPPEQVPAVQRELVAMARAHRKPCIVATQMLESMIEHPQPTRAEVSDVSTAVLSGADAVMLSAETASGRFPVEAVQMMDRIARHIEAQMFAETRFGSDTGRLAADSGLEAAVARCIGQLSRDLPVRAILVVSSGGTGATARVISAARPGAPIIGATSSERTMHQMSLLWGVIPRLVSPTELSQPDDIAGRMATELGLADPAGQVISVEGFSEGAAPDIPNLTILSL
jgi:pyruvate kinase